MMVFTSAATKDRGFDERGIVGSMQQSFEEDCFSIGQGRHRSGRPKPSEGCLHRAVDSVLERAWASLVGVRVALSMCAHEAHEKRV